MNQWLIRTFIQNPDKTSDQAVRHAYGTLASWTGILGNVILCIIKAMVGISIQSVAIVADAANNLSDTASNIVTLLGFKLSARPADKEHPYGHGRFEYLSSLVVSALILTVGFQVILTSGKSVLSPNIPTLTTTSIIIMLLSVGVKLWMSSFNKTVGGRIDSQALLSASQDSRNDCIVTLSVLGCTALSSFLQLPWINGAVGIIVGLLILKGGWECMVESVNPLLGSPADPEKIEAIRSKILSYDEVLGVHDLVLHDYGPGRTFASAHVELPSTLTTIEAHEILDAMQFDFYINEQIDLTAHLDPRIKNDEPTIAIRTWLEEHKNEISDTLSFHDFHTSEDEGNLMLTVDCMAPFSLELTDEELLAQLCNLLRSYDPDITFQIRIDRE